MNVERWRRIDDLLSKALELPSQDRASFIERACDGDSDLHSEVTSLLAHEAPSLDFIETPVFSLAAEFLATAPPDRWTNRLLGSYRIVRQIGHGGMGMVFLAERQGAEFRQAVALKVVRSSLADNELMRRFKREQQILASLTHSNIALLLDGGVSEDGEPYLAMEYVEGIRIDEYCNQNNLSIDERLKLFLEVCRGVAYAHQHLVVHRDLKPSNILVTREGLPKLLDFGIAKLLDEEEITDITKTTLRAFTLEYASPEQLRGQSVTTTADVYSLGVILYELLTGSRPYKFSSGSAEEIARFLESAPSRVTARDHLKRSTTRTTASELDNIAFKALMREPSDRYSSVDQFALDIERYLAGLPVLARPNTLAYRTSKFIQRNRIAVSAAALILLTLIAGLGVSFYQYRRARREQIKVEAVNGYLQKLLLSNYPGAKGSDVNAILDVAARELEQEALSSEPEVKAQLESILGRTYLMQGRYDQAEKFLRRAHTSLTALYGKDSLESLQALQQLAQLSVAQADYDGAQKIYRRIVPLFRDAGRQQKVSPLTLQAAYHDFGVLRRAQGDSKEAESLLREAFALRSSIPPELQGPTRQTQTVLALTLLDQGKLAEAKSLALQLVTEFRQLGRGETPEMCAALTILGSVLLEQNELEAAETSLREAELLYRNLFSPNFTATYDNLRLQAQVRYQQGHLRDASVLIDTVLDNYRKNSNPRYINYATALTIKGMILNKGGQAGEAEKILREAVALREANLPPEHFMTALTKGALGECLMSQKKYAEAEPFLKQSYDSLLRSQPAGTARVQSAKSRIDNLYRLQNRRTS